MRIVSTMSCVYFVNYVPDSFISDSVLLSEFCCELIEEVLPIGRGESVASAVSYDQ